MTYARLENGQLAEYPVVIDEIRKRFPNTSFPIPFEPPDGYVEVAETAKPQVDHTKSIKESTPVERDGKYFQTWVIENASKEEVDRRTQSMATEVRARRDTLLRESDWTQLADSPLRVSLWTRYRQQLRDISSQQEFPWNVTWPNKPT